MSDYADGTAPPEALARTAEQVVWNAPDAGKWQVLIWAPGFSGNGFSEPFRGVITLDTPHVAPASWTTTAAPGDTVTKDFIVTNDGPTALDAYAGSQVTLDGVARFDAAWTEVLDGGLPTKDGGGSWAGELWVPQNVQQVTVFAWWTQYLDEVVDLGLYDPAGADVAQSLATTDEGNAVQVQNPMSGLWTVTLAYGDPGANPPPLEWALQAMFVAPIALDGFSAPDEETPVAVAAGGTGTITASITVPNDAVAGDTVTGTVELYTTADQVTAAGGDHLGSVPVTITVARPN